MPGEIRGVCVCIKSKGCQCAWPKWVLDEIIKMNRAPFPLQPIVVLDESIRRHLYRTSVVTEQEACLV